MKKYYSLVLMLTFVSCTTIHEIIISDLQIGKVITNDIETPDSLILSLLNLDTNAYELDKSKRILKYKIIFIDSIVIEHPYKDSVIMNPVIPIIHFKQVRGKYPKKLKFKDRTIVILQHSIGSIIINAHPVLYNDNIPRDSIVNAKYKEVHDRFDSLNVKIENKLKLEPDNALRKIKSTKYYKEIQNVLDDVFAYMSRPDHVASISEEKIEALTRIEFRIEDIGAEMNNPDNSPVGFACDLFFDPGQYEINTMKNKTELEKYIQNIIKAIDSMRTNEGSNISLIIATTGYTDDIPIVDPLKSILNASNPERKCGDNQDCLNQLLSEKRAMSILNYVKDKVNGYCLKNQISISFKDSEAKGNGKLYPKNISNCPGDCKERRLVNISIYRYNY